ncbi:hypothetical protein [Deinococcus petrolearius]|uniref:HPt domain-containing protein n=1 Tax=Deinococcus petrolearius TaxID=1751295 RepID=A0ABW1DKZ9_9DEIO
MPRKKTDPEITITPLPGRGLDMMEMLEGMAGDLAMESGEAMMAAVEFEKALLNIAHTLAGQAVRVDELAQEDERVKAAERQIKLLGKLYGQLQVITQPPGR